MGLVVLAQGVAVALSLPPRFWDSCCSVSFHVTDICNDIDVLVVSAAINVAAVFSHIQGNHGVAGGQVVTLPAIGFYGHASGLETFQDADGLSVFGVGAFLALAICKAALSATVAVLLLFPVRGLIADTGGIDDEHGVVGECDTVL